MFEGEELAISKQGESKIEFSKQEMAIFEDWKVKKLNMSKSEKSITLHSVTYNAFPYVGKSKIIIDDTEQTLQRGLNILTYVENKYLVESFDTYEDESHLNNFVEQIKHYRKSNTKFAIVSNDNLGPFMLKYRKELNSLGLTVLATLINQSAYVSYVTDYGSIIEKQDASSVQLMIPDNVLKLQY